MAAGADAVSGKHAATAPAVITSEDGASATSGAWAVRHPGRHVRPRLRSARPAALDRARTVVGWVPAWVWLLPAIVALMAVAVGSAAIALHRAVIGDWLSFPPAAFTSGTLAAAAVVVWQRAHSVEGR